MAPWGVQVKRLTKMSWQPMNHLSYLRLLEQGRFKPCLGPDFRLLLSIDKMLGTCMLLVGVSIGIPM